MTANLLVDDGRRKIPHLRCPGRVTG